MSGACRICKLVCIYIYIYIYIYIHTHTLYIYICTDCSYAYQRKTLSKAVKQSSLGIVAVCKELEHAAAVLLDKKMACTAYQTRTLQLAAR